MPRSQLLSLALSAVFAFAFAGCSTDSTTNENTGSLSLDLELAPGITINEVDWTIAGGDMTGLGAAEADLLSEALEDVSNDLLEVCNAL